MKKFILSIIFTVFLITVFNIKVTTRQCVDFKCQSIELPLYLKALDFFDRHYNYQELTKRIIGDVKDEEGRMKKILEWTYRNIKKPPNGFPIIDDHAWHIIIRGYGVEDQSQDVFTTLCNYAKINASFYKVYNKDKNSFRMLSLVKVGDIWTAVDAYAGIYFKNRQGHIASIKDLSSGDWQIAGIAHEDGIEDYAGYFSNLPSLDCSDWKFLRAAIQSPMRRFIYWTKTKD